MYNREMEKKVKRVYVDNSVISGMFDANDHPKRATPFWEAVKRGTVRIIVSDVLEREVELAP